MTDESVADQPLPREAEPTRKRPLRLTERDKEALIEAGERWIVQMNGWTYDPKPLRRALDKLEESL